MSLLRRKDKTKESFTSNSKDNLKRDRVFTPSPAAGKRLKKVGVVIDVSGEEVRALTEEEEKTERLAKLRSGTARRQLNLATTSTSNSSGNMTNVITGASGGNDQISRQLAALSMKLDKDLMEVKESLNFQSTTLVEVKKEHEKMNGDIPKVADQVTVLLNDSSDR